MTPTNRPGRRAVIGLVAALAMIGVLIGLPAPGPPARVQASDAPPSLTAVWPRARPVTVAATLANGDGYSPLLILDASTSVGLATSPDSRDTTLVVSSDPAGPRSLQALSPGTGDTVMALAHSGDRLYWLRSGTGRDGQALASLWTATLSGAAPSMLSADAGAAVTDNSQYDLQIADGRLYWVASPPGTAKVIEVRSIALAGGPVSVRTVPGAYTLADWPWLTSAIGTGGPTGGPTGGSSELLNLHTGQRISIAIQPDQQIRCTSTWCRISTATGPGDHVVVERPDGRERRGIASAGGTAAVTDVAVLDRFEIITTALSADPYSVAQRLVLYDLRTRRRAIVSPAVSRVGAHGNWMWWTTGDNETLTWHGLDLRSLA
jgi:hypothetical protein